MKKDNKEEKHVSKGFGKMSSSLDKASSKNKSWQLARNMPRFMTAQ
jgi:hypothetical protein